MPSWTLPLLCYFNSNTHQLTISSLFCAPQYLLLYCILCILLSASDPVLQMFEGNWSGLQPPSQRELAQTLSGMPVHVF